MVECDGKYRPGREQECTRNIGRLDCSLADANEAINGTFKPSKYGSVDEFGF